MDCSICFENLEPSKFVQGLKNRNIDICGNGFKCLDQICRKCIISYSSKICNVNKDYNSALRTCPFCRSKNFESLCVMNYIYFNLKKLNYINGMFKNTIKLDYENDDICYLSYKNSMAIHDRISLVLKTVFDDFKSEIEELPANIKYEIGITIVMEELILEIHDLIIISRDFSKKIKYENYRCKKYNVLEDLCKLYN